MEKIKQSMLIDNDSPSTVNIASGLVFKTHYDKDKEICSNEKPEFEEAATDHEVACHFSD